MSNSGWNRPSSTRPPVQKKPSALRGVVAGLVVVVLALAGAWYFLGDSLTSAEPKAKKTKTIKDVKPAATIPQAKKERVKPKSVDDALANISENAQPLKIKPAAEPVNLRRYTNQVFNTGVEQLMSWVVSVVPGDMPFPMPEIADDDHNNLVGILISPNKVKESDDEHTVAVKGAVERMKKEMLKYLKEGGDPDEFLQYYNKELERMFSFRNDATDEYQNLKQEDPEMAEEFRKKVNEKLEAEGIRKVYKEDDQGDIIEEESETQTESQEV